jgi:hypothetical protein
MLGGPIAPTSIQKSTIISWIWMCIVCPQTPTQLLEAVGHIILTQTNHLLVMGQILWMFHTSNRVNIALPRPIVGRVLEISPWSHRWRTEPAVRHVLHTQTSFPPSTGAELKHYKNRKRRWLGLDRAVWERCARVPKVAGSNPNGGS